MEDVCEKRFLCSFNLDACLAVRFFHQRERASGKNRFQRRAHLPHKRGHTCRTNCEQWGLEYGEYHYHSGKSASGGSNSNKSGKSSQSGKSSGSSGKSGNSGNSNSQKSSGNKETYQSANLSVYYNGTKLTFEQEPIMVDNTTMVPMRDIFETLGAIIDWNANTQTVTARKGDTEIKITIGSKTAYVNGESVNITPAAMIVEGKTMVPLRFVSEALGVTVKWDRTAKKVTLIE
jgi:hypothetical protein